MSNQTVPNESDVARSLPRLITPTLKLLRERLWLQVLIGMVLGIGTGVLLGPGFNLVERETAETVGNWLALPGRLFLASIQFVVIPLVVASVIRGIAAGEGGGQLGKISAMTVLLFLGGTVVAVAIGLTAALLIRPGSMIDGARLQASLAPDTALPSAADIDQVPTGLPQLAQVPDVIVDFLPSDPLTTLVSGDMLQIVVMGLIFGVAMVMTTPEQRRPILDILASLQAACMAIVTVVLRFAPLAVFGLLAQVTARVGVAALAGTGVYVLTVFAGLLALLCVYVIAAALFSRQGVGGIGGFLSHVREVQLLALSTSSSAAVMPLTLSVTENKLKVRSAVARFVIPLGTTINMGGTALYQGVAALFLAQVFGVDVGMSGMLLIVVTATGAAIGSPGTPGVGIVILASILVSLGIPSAGIALILGVDRILDMVRTAVNVTGDIATAVVVDRLVPLTADTTEDKPIA
ncbi:MAG: dicarboxylate/amino acid:cation symporter [Rhodospirillaceae bacterium]